MKDQLQLEQKKKLASVGSASLLQTHLVVHVDHRFLESNDEPSLVILAEVRHDCHVLVQQLKKTKI